MESVMPNREEDEFSNALNATAGVKEGRECSVVQPRERVYWFGGRTSHDGRQWTPWLVNNPSASDCLPSPRRRSSFNIVLALLRSRERACRAVIASDNPPSVLRC